MCARGCCLQPWLSLKEGEKELHLPQVQGWARPRTPWSPGRRCRPAESRLTFQGGDVWQGLGVGGCIQEGSRQARGEEWPCGTHSASQAGRERKSQGEFSTWHSHQPPPPRPEFSQPHLCWASRASFLLRAWSPGGGELRFLTGGGVTSAMGSLAPGSWSEAPLSVFLHLALRFWNQTWVREGNTHTPREGRKSDRRKQPEPKPKCLLPMPGPIGT